MHLSNIDMPKLFLELKRAILNSTYESAWDPDLRSKVTLETLLRKRPPFEYLAILRDAGGVSFVLPASKHVYAALDCKAPYIFPGPKDVLKKARVVSSRIWEAHTKIRGTPCVFGPYIWVLSELELEMREDDLRLLLLDAIDTQRQRMERLRRKFDPKAKQAGKVYRDAIPESVRIFVWRRDCGRCVQCGSNERLEFDHVIPVTHGGSSSERNVQLLCERCNRSKSSKV